MRNFPPPHPDELLYSAIARAGMYLGITSPKQLLDELFNNRKVIATLDLPSHISHIADQLRNTKQYSVDCLINRHTLFPLYAPFVQQEIRDKAIELMKGKAGGAVHMMLGVSASRIKAIHHFQACTQCIEAQIERYGEAFWKRDWFIPNLPFCMEHGSLFIYKEKPTDSRHHFLPLIESNLSLENVSSITSQDSNILSAAQQLLQCPPLPSISFDQWSHFYRELAHDFGYTRGEHIKHAEIQELFLQHWGKAYLQSKQLLCRENEENSWLKSIFRKHRKSFSFFEHLLVWQTFLPQEKLEDIFQYINKIQPISVVKIKSSENDLDTSKQAEYRNLWQELVRKYGIQSSRSQKNGGAIYIWLYRHDNPWLIQFNYKHQMVHPTPPPRVNWHQRDLKYVRKLIYINQKSKDNLHTPRQSTNWYLMQLPEHATISHNLYRLPMVSKFLIRYAENVTEYQLRRICSAVEILFTNHQELHLWRIFRLAGLSKERLTSEAAKILKLSGFFYTDDSKN